MPELVRVFLSHSHEDRDFAARLAYDLKGWGCEVWWDESLNHGDFLRFIDQGSMWAEWTVLVLSPAAIASTYVQDEIYAALARVKLGAMLGVIPVMAKPCAPGSIPPQWEVLHRYDATDVVFSYDDTMLRIAHTIGRWLPEWEALAPIDIHTPEAGDRVVHFSHGYGAITRMAMLGAYHVAEVHFDDDTAYSVVLGFGNLRYAP